MGDGEASEVSKITWQVAPNLGAARERHVLCVGLAGDCVGKGISETAALVHFRGFGIDGDAWLPELP